MRGLSRILLMLSLFIAPLAAFGASPQSADVSAVGKDSRKNDLEIHKLEEEIEKLKFDQNIGWIAPVLSALSIVMLAASLISQRKTALEIQKRSEQTNFELKVADLLMSSQSPAVAEARMNVLTRLYEDRLRKDFKQKFEKKDFHSPRYHELRLEVFKQMSAKASRPDEVARVFKRVFSNEESIYAEISRRSIRDAPVPVVGAKPPAA